MKKHTTETETSLVKPLLLSIRPDCESKKKKGKKNREETNIGMLPEEIVFFLADNRPLRYAM